MTSRPLCAFNEPSLAQHSAYQRLQHLPLAQPTLAEQELIELLDTILRGSPDADTLFPLLEELRSSFSFVREAAVRHYLEKAPHLDADEEEHFQRGIDSTYLMVRSYTRCADLERLENASRIADDSARVCRAATVLHRCLHYSGMLIFEHYRAKRELPAGSWAHHNTLFSTARRLGIATLPIQDQIFDETRVTHCQAAFITPLLVELSRPYGRNARDLNLIWQWAEHAAHEVSIKPFIPTEATSGYGIDFDQDAPLRPLSHLTGGCTSSQVETAALTSHLRLMLERLAQGAAPERLGLCPETVDNSTRLLGQLASLWSLESGLRKQPRTQMESHAAVCVGFPGMHHFILATEPSKACLAQLKRLEDHEILHRLESWEIIDCGPAGFRLACHATSSKVTNKQLIALRPDDESAFQIGQVEWLKREQSGRLLAGIAILPGTPHAVCARAAPQIKGQKASFARAFLLQDEHSHPQQTSILLPHGMARPHETLELLHDRQWEIRLGEEIQRGADFIHLNLS